MRAFKFGSMLFVLFGLGIVTGPGCAEKGEKGVQVGGAVEDPAVEAMNRASEGNPVAGAPARAKK